MRGTVPVSIERTRPVAGGTVAGVTDRGSGAAIPRGGAEPPMTLRCVVGLLFVESFAVMGLLGYEGFTATIADWRNAVIVIGFAVIIAVLLGYFGWSLWRRRAWARGPAVVGELMLVPIGWYMTTGGVAWLGVPVLVLGLVGAGLLVAPATSEALGTARPAS
jgi:hypothetical protein